MEIMILLLKKGAIVHRQNKKQQTAVSLALANSAFHTLSPRVSTAILLMLNHRADSKVFENAPAEVQSLLEYAKAHGVNRLLTYALEEPGEQLLVALLLCGAEEGERAVHYAVRKKYSEPVLKKLCEGKPKTINVLNGFGQSPLFIALQTRNNVAFETLLRLGASTSAGNPSAYDFAKSNPEFHMKPVKFIESAETAECGEPAPKRRRIEGTSVLEQITAHYVAERIFPVYSLSQLSKEPDEGALMEVERSLPLIPLEILGVIAHLLFQLHLKETLL